MPVNSWHPSLMGLMGLVTVRYCRIKTMPHVEKKDLLGTRQQECHSRVQSAVAWLKMGNGLYRRGQAVGEGESFCSDYL
jgi:hypothetical protein